MDTVSIGITRGELQEWRGSVPWVKLAVYTWLWGRQMTAYWTPGE